MSKGFFLVLFSVVLHNAAPAAELAVESFDGTLTNTLNGAGSGSGWSGNWTRSGGTANATQFGAGNSFVAGGATVDSTGLAAHLNVGSGGGEDLFRDLDTTYVMGDQPGEYPVLYLSFLIDNRPDGNVPGGHAYNVRLRNGGSDVVTFGKRINNPWVLQDDDESVDFTGNAGNSNKGNWLAIVKLEFDGTNTTVNGYLAEELDAGLDPTDLDTYLRTGSTTITGKATFNRVFIESHNTVTARVDEIRISDDLDHIGTGNDPRIETTDLNLVNDGTPESFALTVGNTGITNDLVITGVTPGGTNANTVTVDTNFPLTIAAGSEDVIAFTFSPDQGSVPYQFTLAIASNDAATPTRTVTINVAVQDPVIEVSASAIDFGTLAPNPGPQTQTVTVSNAGGTQDLILNDLTGIIGGDAFTLTAPALPATIAPGASTDLEITFDPGQNVGRSSALLRIFSNDINTVAPTIPLTGFVEPSGVTVAQFDFDPNNLTGSLLDIDDSEATSWTTGDLIDQATGTGALNTGNQEGANRNVATGFTGNVMRFSSNREGDAATPTTPGGNDESTWTRFTVTPGEGGGAINFTGGTAVVDTYAFLAITGATSADWTLYFSLDGGTSWTSLGSSAGASINEAGVSPPVGLSWDLSPVGIVANTVDFILDPVSTGATNGTTEQRSIGFDNLILTAGSIIIGSGDSFDAWAALNGVADDPNGDTDGDGIEELVEYALGLDPNVFDRSAGTLVNNTLTFSKGTAAVENGDVTYAIETSSDLGQTDPWTVVPEEDLASNDDNTISYELPAGSGKIFARLQVKQLVSP